MSRSYFSLPNARTTRTPVRFSCASAESTPSCSSHSLNRLCIITLNPNDTPVIAAISPSDTPASVKFIVNINITETTIVMIMRSSATIWFEMKLDRFHTSEVQRWITSPVLVII